MDGQVNKPARRSVFWDEARVLVPLDLAPLLASARGRLFQDEDAVDMDGDDDSSADQRARE